MRFKYLGETTRSFVTSYGPTKTVQYQKKDGTTVTLTPVPPATEFVIGQDLGYDITDSWAIQMMSADTRFQQI